MSRVRGVLSLMAAGAMAGQWVLPAQGQGLFDSPEDVIPLEVETLYVKGMDYLIQNQDAKGSWSGGMGSQPAVVGLAVLSLLAHGDDPNHGPYSAGIRRGLDFILSQQNKESGYIGSSMYNHGFAALALAEAYGAVEDARLGPALEKSVQLILSAQARNAFGGWRYSPTSQDADTTVSGAQMVALFAARNAGLGVPEEAIQKGLKFYTSCQGGDGGFGYTGPGGSNGPRTAIGALVYTLARRKGEPEHKAAMRFLKTGELAEGGYYHYHIYYASQAFFHDSDASWEDWNRINVKLLVSTQKEDGSWDSSYGSAFGTASSLLSVALNYRYLPIYER